LRRIREEEEEERRRKGKLGGTNEAEGWRKEGE
jgi:hypothetical protein